MITNSDITIYHKTFNKQKKIEEWERYNFNNVWWFGNHNAGINKGYEEANDVDVRIFYDTHNVDLSKFSIGDIIVKGNLNIDISTQQDLKNYDIFNITLINDNNFGTKPHLHLGAK